jgi:hypothetical protein
VGAMALKCKRENGARDAQNLTNKR